MLRLIGLAISIGLADSINPTTIAPGLYLGAGDRARARVAEFTAAVFAVSLAAGAVIALGPGQLLLSLVPHPRERTRSIIEVVVGAAMLAAGAFLWVRRRRSSGRSLPQFNSEGRSVAVLGATIAAIELPTAFPYFAVVAAIVGSGEALHVQILLLVLFNVCFVSPLLAILAVLTLAGERAVELLAGAREKLERNWRPVLAVLLIVAGTFVLLLGIF